MSAGREFDIGKYELKYGPRKRSAVEEGGILVSGAMEDHEREIGRVWRPECGFFQAEEKKQKKLAGREFGDLRTVPKLPR